jgi:type I restriction enzyme S subunit
MSSDVAELVREADALPDGWRTVRLGDVSRSFSGGTPSRSKTAFYGRGIPWLKSGEVRAGRISVVKEQITEAGLRGSSTRVAKAGSPVIAMYGATAGVAGILEIDAALNQAVLAIEPVATKLDNEFCFCLLSSEAPRLLTMTQGSGQPNLSKGLIDGLHVALPPLDEQRQIADVLRSVDEAIAAAQAVHDAAIALRHATFAAFLRSGDRADGAHEIAEWTTGQIEGVERLPSEWRIAKLIDVARLESGHTPNRQRPDYWDGGDVEWISLHDTKNLEQADIGKTELRITKAGLANSSARLLPVGTVCLSRTATVGKCVIMAKPMATSQDFANFVCSEELNNRYLLHLIRWMQPVWKALASGSTHQTIYMPTFKALQIVVPTRADQDAIAGTMDGFVSVIDGYAAELNRLRAMKVTLMSDLLSGKVRVPA